MPSALPAPIVPSLDCHGGCTAGTSDDGTGDFALHWQTATMFGGAAWAFFQIENGHAVQRSTTPGYDQSGIFAFSQPSGFFLLNAGPDGNSLYIFSNAGAQTGDVGLGGAGDGVAVASDPSGGFSAAMQTRNPSSNGVSSFHVERYDKSGAHVSASGEVFSGPSNYNVAAAGMTLSHDTLVLLNSDLFHGDAYEAFWIGADGTKRTNNFAVHGGTLQFLLDGTLLQRSGSAFTAVWTVGATTPAALPDWLAARANAQWLYPIAQGAGYATGGTCAGVEVLSKGGKSCGCLAVPGLSAMTSIGRDGSLIVPRLDHYELYPLLFH
jgi:hypothetical protein